MLVLLCYSLFFSQTGYGEFLYNIGLLDRKQKEVFEDHSRQTVEAINNKVIVKG